MANFSLSYCCNYFFAVYTAVHCRTGSLENCDDQGQCDSGVHCRTGSLEKQMQPERKQIRVHCRTGSFEKTQKIQPYFSVCLNINLANKGVDFVGLTSLFYVVRHIIFW